MLTLIPARGYSKGALTKSGAGIGVLNPKSAQALIRSAFFAPAVYGGCHGSSSERGFSLGRNANPVASATLLIGVNGGGSQTKEDSTMSHDKSALLPVPFHGNPLYIVEHNGEPYTPMKPIVEGMGLDWCTQ